MSQNNGGVTNLGEKSILEFEESPPYDDEGGVGDLNYTPLLGETISNIVLIL
jgi:hypothetical protein